MPQTLSAAQVAALSKDGDYRVDRNLYIQVRDGGRSKSWVFRYRFQGRLRRMGMGPYDLLTLNKARDRSEDHRRQLRDGIDPLEAKNAERERKTITFEAATEEYLKAHEAGWSSPKHSHQVRAHLKTYAYPAFGKRPVDRITINDVARILEPIWVTKHETATRVRARIEAVLDWAKSAGYRTGDNPAAWKAGLQHRLPPSARVAKVQHHEAVPWPDAPAVFAKLTAVDTMASKLLRFIALTGVRYSEAAWARWAEFDLEAPVPVWTVPAERMKGRKPHRVPLSAPAVAILKSISRREDRLVFKGTIPSKPVSDTRLRSLLREVCAGQVTTHGWRSTLRDWAAEATSFPPMVAEAAIAHSLGTRVEVAYLRSDLYEQRVRLMAEWGEFLTVANP